MRWGQIVILIREVRVGLTERVILAKSWLYKGRVLQAEETTGTHSLRCKHGRHVQWMEEASGLEQNEQGKSCKR